MNTRQNFSGGEIGEGRVRYAVAICDIRAVGWATMWVRVEEKRVDVTTGLRGEGACRCTIKREPDRLYVRRDEAKGSLKQQTFPGVR